MEFKKIIINDNECDVVVDINDDEIENNNDILYEDTIDLSDIVNEVNNNLENRNE